MPVYGLKFLQNFFRSDRFRCFDTHQFGKKNIVNFGYQPSIFVVAPGADISSKTNEDTTVVWSVCGFSFF
jgi:hypothetical protein